MGTKYTSQTITGYNATPPADDGTETEANKGYWATIKTKLGDPVKTYADDINSAMATFADYGPVIKSATYTTVAADHLKTIDCSGTFTLTLGAVATMGAGYIVTIKNSGTGVITVDGDGAETIDGALTVVLDPSQSIGVQVSSGASEYIILNDGRLESVGTVSFFAGTAVPPGWLEMDGDPISRTDYANLFAKIGTRYGVGDGSTTFNLPDARGLFGRFWDNGAGVDPDAATRTDSGDGTTGDNVGTQQTSQNKQHEHDLATNSTNVNGTTNFICTANSGVAAQTTVAMLTEGGDEAGL